MKHHVILLACLVVPLGGCMLGPDYHRPAPIISAQFKEQAAPAGWHTARPDMSQYPKGNWWTVFADTDLDRLEEQVAQSNQGLKEYEAQYRKAAATINATRASLYPSFSGSLSLTRTGAARTANNAWSTGPSASWTIDVWGKIRRQIEEQVTATQAEAALVAAMRLSYQLTLAQYYFNLRYQDSLIDLYRRNARLYRHNLTILRHQADAGVSDPTSVLQATYLLRATEADLVDAHINRADYEHAIATLIGKPPVALSLAHAPLAKTLPAAPKALPSMLLERRPDIAEAERNMESANAGIGYAIAAFFPEISLSASYGYTGDPLSRLIAVAARTWSLGGSATETLFSGGARVAAIREARAGYDNAVATYRQTVLTAMQDTEDQLSTLRYLAAEKGKRVAAVTVARQAVRVSSNAYLAGTVIYTTVITAEQTALSYEEQLLSVRQQQFLAEIALLTDLGGGWTRQSLPTKAALQRDDPLLPAFIQADKNGIEPDNKAEHHPDRPA